MTVVAKINGELLEKIPNQVYIPPAALKIILQQFEGPLDLLLYLIKKQNLDILQLPITPVCEQYIQYIDVMQKLELDLAAEYLAMAAWLIEIKSRLLLPKPQQEEAEDPEDPRVELVRQLQNYEHFKNLAERLDKQPLVNRDIFVVQVNASDEGIKPKVAVIDLIKALDGLKKRKIVYAEHPVIPESISIEKCMDYIVTLFSTQKFAKPIELWQLCEHKTPAGKVGTFIATLELTRKQYLTLSQAEPFSKVWVEKNILDNQLTKQ